MAEVPSERRMTYGGYLRLEDLLQLQEGPEGYSPSPCNDETHFIIVHQAFELWFKLILSELKSAHQILNSDKVDEKGNAEVGSSFRKSYLYIQSNVTTVESNGNTSTSRVFSI